MNIDIITIVKKPGIKDCVRIRGKEDIPEFLKDVIKIEKTDIVLDCLEGEERTPLNSVIAYEKLENGKMNVWNKANWRETTIEKNGVFYEIPKPNKAVLVTEEIPDSIVMRLKDRLIKLNDGTFQLDTNWGILRCEPYNGYLVIYGQKEDGSLDVNFLTKGTPSFKQYFVVDEKGNIIESLEEYDIKMQEELLSQSKRI